MKTSASFTINITGEDSGNPYNGSFTVKTLLSRGDYMKADEARRRYLGFNPEAAVPRVASDAFMFGQLSVRITDAPQWWVDSKGGYDLSDSNVIEEIFGLAVKAESDRKESIIKSAASAKKAIVDGVKVTDQE